MTDIDEIPIPEVVDCLVIGGVANGMTVRSIQSAAEYIELSRPMTIKPLAYSTQEKPEIVKETDKYRLHVIAVQEDEHNMPRFYGLLVQVSMTIYQGFEKLLINYVQSEAHKTVAAAHQSQQEQTH